MTSKRQLSNTQAARRIQEAMRKAGCAAREFFARAGRKFGYLDLDLEVENFGRFMTYGVTNVKPSYKVPDSVLRLADEVLAPTKPRGERFASRRRPFFRPGMRV